jgi:hypothetical protein
MYGVSHDQIISVYLGIYRRKRVAAKHSEGTPVA